MPDLEPSRAPSGLPWKTIAWVVVAVYALLFVLLNNDKQDVSFVVFSVRTRLIWLILLSMGLGALLMWLGGRWWAVRQSKTE
jgi:uncharacterized integral membrane protein